MCAAGAVWLLLAQKLASKNMRQSRRAVRKQLVRSLSAPGRQRKVSRPFRLASRRVGPAPAGQFILGLTRVAAFIAIELAEADEADLDERISTLRSFAVTASLQTGR